MPGKVVVIITPTGIERIQLAAETAKDERASLALYRQIRPAIDSVKTLVTPKGRRPGDLKLGGR